MTGLTRFAWGVVAYNLLVVAWGAYVRATGSGAGCGAHWPLCNGEVVPRAPRLDTLIELSHRLTSGLALLAVVALVVWVFRRFDAGHPARWGAVASLVLIFVEAGIGAGLVLFELVADNASIARALSLAAHLVNTFLLLAALALTAWWTGPGAPLARPRGDAVAWRLLAALAGMVLVGMSGAISALGDTLYPSGTLAEALAADLSGTSHVLIRLRIYHPLIAVVVGLFAAFQARAVIARRTAGTASPGARKAVSDTSVRLAQGVILLVFLQLAVGTLNVALLAPVWLQLVHLLLADALWLALVLLVAERSRADPATVTAGRSALVASASL